MGLRVINTMLVEQEMMTFLLQVELILKSREDPAQILHHHHQGNFVTYTDIVM